MESHGIDGLFILDVHRKLKGCLRLADLGRLELKKAMQRDHPNPAVVLPYTLRPVPTVMLSASPDVLRSIQRLQTGLGFEAGLAVVILAIILDRLTAGFTRKRPQPKP